jgi:hypothetical protein
MPHNTDGAPLIMLPTAQAGIHDGRGRFREIFCAVLEARGETLPDYRPCDVAITSLGVEPPGDGAPVNLGESRRELTIGVVPGAGWGCFEEWLNLYESGGRHVAQFGYEGEMVEIDALASDAVTAAQIRDFVVDWAARGTGRELILMGYSKGAPDILKALVDYPEIRSQVTAVVSLAGSIGGSPLANDASQSQLELLTHWPGADCDEGDGKGLSSLTPETRRNWMANNTLPAEVKYYSLVALPEPDRVSSILRSGWRKLSMIDGRNDSQVMFYDQIIPGSTLVGYLNADHWAVAVPIAREHRMIGGTLVNRNDYPREALLEAVLRYVEEDLAAGSGGL